MKILRLAYIPFILIANSIVAQQYSNLVINGGFEFLNQGSIKKAVNTNYLASYELYNFNNKILGWSSPLSSNPEIMYSNGEFTDDTLFHQFERPFSGKVSIGLQLAAPAKDDPYTHASDYVTFAQGSLSEELIVGQIYYFEVKIKRKENFNHNSHDLRFRLPNQGNDTFHVSRLVACNNFGLYLLNEPLEPFTNVEKFKAIRSLIPVFNYCSLISENGEWETISGWFICNKKARWFLLGNFFTSELTSMSISSADRNFHYIKSGPRRIPEERVSIYYIDDVVISKIPSEIKLNEINNENCSLNQTIQDLSSNIYFETGSSNLDSENKYLIDSISTLLKNINNVKLHIYGYADSTGTTLANLKLSLERAKQVRNYFIKCGLDSLYIDLKAFGEIETNNELGENRMVKIIPEYNVKFSDKSTGPKSSLIYRIPDREIQPEEACFIGQYNLGCEGDPIGSCTDFEVERVYNALAQEYSAINAVDFIDTKSKTTNILYISESHLIGQHRLFVMSLLTRLWDNGYRILLLEALSRKDTSLTSVGYPTLTTGYYTRDPFYGELLRMAISLGYTVESFDTDSNEPGADKDLVKAILAGSIYNRKAHEGTYTSPDGLELELSEGELILSMREFEMATKIEDFLKKAGKNKALIFGGEGHNYKESCGRHVRAGDFLKRYYKRDFLSIVQHSYTKDSLNAFFPFPSNVLVKDNMPYLSKPGYCPFNEIGQEYDIEVLNHYDVSKAFPYELIQKYELNYKENVVNIPEAFRKSKKLLLVYHSKESPSTAIPAFVSMIDVGQKTASLWLVPGEYTYFIRDNNKVFFSTNLSVQN